MSYLLIREDGDEPASISDLDWFEQRLHEQYPNFQDTVMWFKDFRRTYDLSQRNPFTEPTDPTFDDSAAIVEFSHQSGGFQNLECHALKRKLVDMESMGTGRVYLSDFYSGAVDGGDWEFMEPVQYLRNLGVLDETDPRRPSVVIANYMNSLANCLTTSNISSSAFPWKFCRATAAHLRHLLE